LCAVSGSPGWEAAARGTVVPDDDGCLPGDPRERCLGYVSDGDGDPAFLVALADEGVGLDDLLQRIAAVDDRMHAPGFDQAREHREAP